tara:strand:+ start:4554 stop:5843 length:1290 start_codon:yes stop_codon:yes gene_type:complete
MDFKIIFKGLVILLVFFSGSVYSGNEKEKVCPKNPIDNCPKGFLCKNLKPIKGKELKEKMKLLEKEYKKKWTFKGSKVSVGTKIWDGTKYATKKASKNIKAGVQRIQKQIGESAAGKKFSKSKTYDLFKQLRNNVKSYYWVKPMDKDQQSNIMNTEKRTVILEYKTVNIVDDKETPGIGKTKFYVYQSTKWKGQKRPLLIIMPPVYGISPFDIGMAVRYVKHGYRVAILELGGFKFISPFQHTRHIKRVTVTTMGHVHRLIDYMTKEGDVDKKKIGIFGFSLGGLMASLAFSVNKDIKALSLAVGGGNFAEILTNSKQAVAALYRKYRMKEENIKTKEDYFKVMQEAFSFDPIRFAHLRDPNDVYLVFTEGDSAVPSKNQRDLERAFNANCKRGNSRWEQGEHFFAIVKDLLKRDRINNFFKSRFGVDK